VILMGRLSFVKKNRWEGRSKVGTSISHEQLRINKLKILLLLVVGRLVVTEVWVYPPWVLGYSLPRVERARERSRGVSLGGKEVCSPYG
jgi:hypothetical protein